MIYVCLLRGVNVGGRNALPMAELRAAVTRLGCWDVRSYVQSGNLVFSAPDGTATSSSSEQAARDRLAGREVLAARIEALIERDFGIQTPAFLYTPADLRRIVDGNPFLPRREDESESLYVTFLKGKPEASALAWIDDETQSGDVFDVTPCAVYLYCPGGYGGTIYNNAFFEKRLRLAATTRNWKTTLALAAMAAA